MKFKGLSEDVVKQKLAKKGLNEITHAKRPSLLNIFLSQFTDAFSILLLFGVLFSLFLHFVYGEESLTEAFLISLILVANGLISTVQEWKADDTLNKLRQLQKSFVSVIRDGKVKQVESKYVVEGDVVLLEDGVKVPADGVLRDGSLLVDESVLTGESFPVEKIPGDEVYGGTFVLSGKGVMEVERTGDDTRIGKIAAKLHSIKEVSVFKQQLNAFTVKFLRLVVVAVLFFFATTFLREKSIIHLILAAIALIVAVVPEGLAMVAAITMMNGVKRLADRGVLVKKLESVEALGAVEYVIFDKTGTLTQGTLSLAYVSERLKPWLGYFAIADSKDPVEKVLQQFEVKAGTLVEVKPFNYETRTSAVVWKLGDKSKEFVKGAPEVIFSLCGVKDEKAEALAKEGMRALAFAVKEDERWEYLGLVGFEDPLKDTAKRALTEMKESGLVPIMITGDHKETARAIAKQVGIRCVLVSGEEVRKRPKRAIKKILKGGVVYRAKPEDKLLVVEELQTKGFITAATGDGVNDVLLLKRANVGIAMGEGSDIAKESADIVLLKDDLLTIVQGIVEGRTIITNVRKFIAYLLSSNFVELIAAIFLPLIHPKIVLDAPKLLWINLFSDGVPATSLAFDDDYDIVKYKKPSYFRSLFLPVVERLIVVRAVLLGASVLAFFLIIRNLFEEKEVEALFFSVLTLGEVLYLFAVRYLFSNNMFDNKWAVLSVLFVFVVHISVLILFPQLFNVVTPSLTGWAVLFAFLVFSFFVSLLVVKWLKASDASLAQR